MWRNKEGEKTRADSYRQYLTDIQSPPEKEGRNAGQKKFCRFSFKVTDWSPLMGPKCGTEEASQSTRIAYLRGIEYSEEQERIQNSRVLVGSGEGWEKMGIEWAGEWMHALTLSFARSRMRVREASMTRLCPRSTASADTLAAQRRWMWWIHLVPAAVPPISDRGSASPLLSFHSIGRWAGDVPQLRCLPHPTPILYLIKFIKYY